MEKNDPFNTDGYFYLIDTPHREAEVRDSVKSWMEKLGENFRLKDNPQGSLASLLALIRAHVLVVDPNQRIKSKELADKLQALAEIACSEAGRPEVHSLQYLSHDDASESPTSGTPAVTLDAPESSTLPRSASTRRGQSTQELITAQPGSLVKQKNPSDSRSSLPLREAKGESSNALNSSASLASSFSQIHPHYPRLEGAQP